ncbi:MAG: Flp1 family type IVb pilin, partial [Bacillota bacterium]|nr:Flp1 family type IVb pilin [Bacillota bacterium]
MKRIRAIIEDNRGMELVQVGLLIAIAIALGLIFKTQITGFVNDVFGGLKASSF